VAVQRTDSSGNMVSLTPDQERGYLVMTVQQHLTRTVMSQPKPIDPSIVQANAGDVRYLYVNTMTLSRPVYLKILVVLAVLLIAAAAFFAVMLCPFDQLIINTEAVVLGIWAVRSLLLGGFPPDATLVDLALMVTIFAALVGITVLPNVPPRARFPFLLPGQDFVVEREVELKLLAAAVAEPGVRHRHLFVDAAFRLPAEPLLGL
jgi:hypothetical protein